MKKYLLVLLIALSFNAFGQKRELITFSDNYAEYSLTKTSSEWSKKNVPSVMIVQLETNNFYDNYWESSVTLIKTPEIIEYLKETRKLYIEMDSINKTENNLNSYSYDLNELNCLKGHKAELCDNLTLDHTYGVKISSTYMFVYVNENINKSYLRLSFLNNSNNRIISSVGLSLSIDQLDNLINKLEKF